MARAQDRPRTSSKLAPWQTGHHSESLQHAEEGVIWFYFAQYHILRHNLRRIPTDPRARPEPAAPEHAQPPRPGRLDVARA